MALGSLSLIFWALIITIPVKYCLFVMRADNHGEGGILALMSMTGANWSKGRRTLIVDLRHRRRCAERSFSRRGLLPGLPASVRPALNTPTHADREPPRNARSASCRYSRALREISSLAIYVVIPMTAVRSCSVRFGKAIIGCPTRVDPRSHSISLHPCSSTHEWRSPDD
jgi:hypothetical protein